MSPFDLQLVSFNISVYRLLCSVSLNLFISIITLAIILTYFPQFQRIITRNSSHGISPYYILLSTVFTTSALANSLLLRSANGDYDCCKRGDIHGSACFTALAATVQAALHFLGSVILLVIYLIFYPRPPLTLSPSTRPKRHSLSKSDLALSPERRRALSSQPYPRLPKLIALAATLLIAFILIPAFSIAFSDDIASHGPQSLVQEWSFFTATLALLEATVQFLPQLYTTLRLKHHASLSLVMLAVQSPVSVALGVSKSLRNDDLPNHDEGSRTWLRFLRNGEMEWMAYVITGTLEMSLLALGLYFSYTRPRGGEFDGDDEVWDEERREEEEEYISGVGVNEETPLLPGRRENELRGSRKWAREMMAR
ncbi:MAG: hypothetical protein Q9219_000930 [cf. Caloplaca sp. 3 TL-2023]